MVSYKFHVNDTVDVNCDQSVSKFIEDFNSVRIKSCKPRCRTGCLEGEPDACCSDECAGGCTGTITNCIASILEVFFLNYFT